jgi:hypothetical protein
MPIMNDEAGGAPRVPFCEWLAVASTRAGAHNEVELSRLLVDRGCYCTPATTAAWLAGTQEPSPEKARLMLAALNAAIANVDVWEEFGRWKAGEPFFIDADNDKRTASAPSLSDVVEAGGLPPPLTD